VKAAEEGVGELLVTKSTATGCGGIGAANKCNREVAGWPYTVPQDVPYRKIPRPALLVPGPVDRTPRGRTGTVPAGGCVDEGTGGVRTDEGVQFSAVESMPPKPGQGGVREVLTSSRLSSSRCVAVHVGLGQAASTGARSGGVERPVTY